MTGVSTPGGGPWLADLQAQLGADAHEIAATLLTELSGALSRAGEAVRTGQMDAAAQAAHAARSSALLLDDRPLVDALGELEGAARALDGTAVAAAHARVTELWDPLRERLRAASAASEGGAGVESGAGPAVGGGAGPAVGGGAQAGGV